MAQAIVFLLQPLLFWLLVFPRGEVAFRRFLLLFPFLPSYMGLRVGGFGITAARCAMMYLLLGVALREPRRFKLRIDPLDLCFGVFIASFPFLTGLRPDPVAGLQYCFGKGMDIAVPYLLVRMFVRQSEDLHRFLHALILPSVAVVALAVFQSATGFNLFTELKHGAEELNFGAFNESMARQGVFRADVGLTHFIMLGVWFAMLMPLAHAHFRNIGFTTGRSALCLAAMALGLLCSVSGGSMLAAAAAMGILVLWPLRRVWLLLGMCVVAAIAYVETFSNRHFWVVIASYAATDAASAWYRVYAPEVWMEHYLPGHWWFGYGRELPDMGLYSDITNHYFLFVFHGGLFTLAAFLVTVLAAFHRLRATARAAWMPYLPRVAWSVGASLTGLLLVMFTVSLFGQMVGYLSMLLALPAALLFMARQEADQCAAWARPGIQELLRKVLLAVSTATGVRAETEAAPMPRTRG